MAGAGCEGRLLTYAYIFALAAAGQRGVEHLLEFLAGDMRA